MCPALPAADMIRRPMAADPDLAQRLLDGDKRALARAISLVENDDPAGWELVREVYPRTGNANVVGFTGPPGVGKSTLIGALTKLQRAPEPRRRRAVDRPLVAVHPRGAAGRPHPSVRALPRPRGVHPLDGQPGRAGRAVGGGAAGRAADGRRRQGRRVHRDGRGGPGRGRHHRPRRHDRAGAAARLRRLDPGAQGRGDGDPRRDRGQQVRAPADRHDDPRDQGRAGAGPHGGLVTADRSRRGRARRGSGGAGRTSWPSTAPTSRRRARCWSAGAAT